MIQLTHYISTSASSGSAAMLLSPAFLPRPMKGRYKSSEGINVLQNYFVPINSTSFIIGGMADKLHVFQVCVAS